jgi:uncharacterized protein
LWVWLYLLAVGVALCLTCDGCRKPNRRMPAPEIHVITREFAGACSTVAPSSDVRTEFSANDEDQSSSDRVQVILRFASSDSQDRATSVARLLQALGRVATQHGLTEGTPSQSEDVIRFTYSRGGYATHAVRVRLVVAEQAQESPSVPAPGARLAVILDDVGTDRAVAEKILALPFALTVSILPNHPHSVDIAEQAHRRGYQVMLHLPMQSVGNAKPEPEELRRGMSADEVGAMVTQFLQSVPDVVGVNNHQGSQSTADVGLMDALMPVVRDHKLFYIDSRTTKQTVAYDAARRAGVRCAFRNVPFLDDVAETSAVRKQLQTALRGAREHGEAIAIGHPHPATLAALKQILPQAKEQGVQLVFASDLVH